MENHPHLRKDVIAVNAALHWEAEVFFKRYNNVAEGQRFLLDVVMRVCPCVACKHLHILYGYIPAVEESLLLQKTTFATQMMCNIADT